MKKMLLLVLCVSVSLSHCASFAHEHAHVYNDDLKDKEEVTPAAFVNGAELQATTYLVYGRLYFQYTSNDAGSYYEPFGNVNLNVGQISQNIWSATADSIDVRLGSGISQSFAFQAVSVSPISIDGLIEESDLTNNDEIATMSLTINVDDVMAEEQTYRFNGEDGYAELTLRVSALG